MKKLFEELLCDNCQLPLSLPPTTLSKQGTFCGRCPNKNGIVLTIYETLAKNQYFPCQNRTNGCTYLGKYHSIANHEETCSKDFLQCPITGCQEPRFPLHQSNNHWTKNHPTCVLTQTKFTINIDQVDKAFKVTVKKDFAVLLFFEISSVGLQLTVGHFGSSLDKVCANCHITIGSEDGQESISWKIQKMGAFSSETSNRWNIDSKMLDFVTGKTPGMEIGVNFLENDVDCVGTKTPLEANSNSTFYVNFNNNDNVKDDCPLSASSKCNFLGNLEEISRHFLKEHKELCCANMAKKKIQFIPTPLQVEYLVVKENLFKTLREIKSDCFYWKIMLIGSESQKFNFILKIFNKERQMQVTDKVVCLSSDCDFNKNSVRLNYAIIAPYLDQNTITYDVEITKHIYELPTLLVQ